MATEKNRHSRTELQKAVPWFYWLTAHSLVHGGAIYLVTRSVTLGVIETILHWIIDFVKCEGWTSIHTDQFLHVACRVLYCYLIVSGIWPSWEQSLGLTGYAIQ